MPAPIPVRAAALRALVGNTPLLAVTLRYNGTVRTIYAKAEYLNLSGSIKDRMALHILCSAYASGALRPGMPIMEATSGNAGIAFAALGAALGHPVTIYMPDWMSQERVALIRSYGAEVVPVSKAQGGFLGSIRLMVEEQQRAPETFLTRQFENQHNCEAHTLTTAPEILHQLGSRGIALAAFVAGVGTGGTVMGVAQGLRNAGSSARVHPVEPLESPTLSTGHKVGSHRIQGISDEFIPDILKLPTLAPILTVSDGDSILMAQKIASTFGLGVGISSGCNLLAAVLAQESLPPGAAVATIFCDDSKKYLSTDLMREEPVRPGYLTPQIELLDLHVLPRTDLASSL